MSTTATILVIGGTSGVGRAIAEQAAARGDVVIVAGRDQARADAVAQEIGRSAKGVAIDLTDMESIRAAATTLGPIDHLVLSAAALTYAPFAELSVEEAQAVFEKFWG
ncbi:SDR family NAD(P)-dependent oxidoreductase [Cnuibacter sp. UC19_7]|uniref:SDR family NAD(P)-dependent oxidoreductase n=1 Tax=Cnuibacter sp. UC19_7 TaxID=3350166 RepID=UPI003671C878